MVTRELVHIVCLNAGNYCGCGAEYVNKLFDMVSRNLPGTQPFEFHCLTDNADGLDARIKVLPLPGYLHSWWGKLYLFRRGLFPDGSRVVFFDLDTLIVGRLDEIVEYRGQFATLTDFLYPERIGPAVMLWEAGDYVASIWEEWEAEGYPTPAHELGDLWWLNRIDQGRFAKRADRLQDLFPGAFVSYKRHCKPLPPRGTRVVCFHGQPRPHDAQDWVQEVWKVGGLSPADQEFHVNVGTAALAENVRAACTLPHPWLDMVKPHDGECAIVGGGPSLELMLDELRLKAAAGVKVFAVNGAFEYLSMRGITPDYHVVIDARAENARFITTAPREGFYLASQAHPETFQRAAALAPVTIVHMHTSGIEDLIPESIKPVTLISSGITVLLAALAISYCRGYRKHFLYGADSSFEGAHHVYPQPMNDDDPVVEAVVGGRKFKCAPWMIEQAQNFQKLAAELANDGCEIHVRSFGLLGQVAWQMQRAMEEPAEVVA